MCVLYQYRTYRYTLWLSGPVVPAPLTRVGSCSAPSVVLCAGQCDMHEWVGELALTWGRGTDCTCVRGVVKWLEMTGWGGRHVIDPIAAA